MRSEMPRPAASSDAVAMRRPEDRRAKLPCSRLVTEARLRWAVSEATLVLTRSPMRFVPWYGSSEVLRGSHSEPVGARPAPFLLPPRRFLRWHGGGAVRGRSPDLLSRTRGPPGPRTGRGGPPVGGPPTQRPAPRADSLAQPPNRLRAS